jgi:hypothetical protein
VNIVNKKRQDRIKEYNTKMKTAKIKGTDELKHKNFKELDTKALIGVVPYFFAEFKAFYTF